MLYLIVFGSIVALNCYLWLLTRVPAPKVTTYALVNPVVALVLGAVVLDERITPLGDLRCGAGAARSGAGAVPEISTRRNWCARLRSRRERNVLDRDAALSHR